jgi:transcriptional regulator with XRE-family HTH domain
MVDEARPDAEISNLGAVLRARRREKQLSLRDLSDLIGVPPNTLSRVERGDVPDLKNFRRIVEWLELPAERFLEGAGESSTPQIIARHLRADRRLPAESARQIMELVEEMYHRLIGEQPTLTLHLRSAKTFTPGASNLLADILSEMQSNLQAAGS